ncbi:MAG: substrate-binding domain-containing protein, partial [Candidatus Eremiobacteraeota bacterium]|nr:substrate-binding domain-containing protein [Candidatus Eremiobacteraeota bacterium]
MTRRLFAALILPLAMVACTAKNAETSSTTPGGAATKTIGVSIQDMEAQFYQDMVSGMKSEAAKYGYNLLLVDANRDNARQQSQVEDFISKRVDAIVLTPYDSQAIGSAIVEANGAKIPVFTADIANASSQGKVVSHVASDNVQGGAQAAKLMCAAINKVGTVAIIDEPEVTSVQDRVRGFRSGPKQDCPLV